MATFNEQLPTWTNPGNKPTDEVIDAGWKVKDRPPAAWFNWNWHQTYKCLEELRIYLDNQTTNKQSIPLLLTTYNAGVYSVSTPNSPATSYINGMVMNIYASADSASGAIYINLDMLGNKLVYVEGQVAGRRTFIANRIYTVVYSSNQNGWVIMNVVNRLDKPPIFSGNMNQMLYSGRFIAQLSNLTNGPSTTLTGMDDDSFIITSEEIQSGVGATNQFVQTCISINSLAVFQRTINNSGGTIKDWQEPIGNSFKTSINVDDIFSNLMGSGLVATITAMSVSITPGYIYTTANGLIRSTITQTFNPPTSDGGYILSINKSGVVKLTTPTVPPGHIEIYRWMLSGTTISNVDRLIKPITFKSTMLGITQPAGTNDTTLATTEFVTRAMGSISSDAPTYIESGSLSSVRTVTIPGITNYDQMTDKVFLIRAAFNGLAGEQVTLNVNGLGTKNLRFLSGLGWGPTPTIDWVITGGGIYAIYLPSSGFTSFNVFPMTTFEADTTKKGIVQLNDNVNSISVVQAATANAVKKAYDKAVEAVTAGGDSPVYDDTGVAAARTVTDRKSVV